MLESELRGHDIKWVCNAKTTRVEAGLLHTTELDDLGQPSANMRSLSSWR